MKKDAKSEADYIVSGPICSISTSKGDSLYKGGAVTSAFMSVFL